MLISKLFHMEDMDMWDEDEESEEFADHIELKERLRRSLYFGKTPKMDRSSLPMTELTVEYFQEAVPRELGRVDMNWASSVSRKASISPCAMMLGMLYIERLRHKNPDYIEKMSSEELFLISMMLASKYLYDEGVPEEVYNDEWAESADLDLEDINQLEREFLLAIDWNLFVNEDEFLHVLDALEEQTALRQGLTHGFLTYNDLCSLLKHGQLKPLNWHLLREVCKVFAVCSLAYTAGSLTMAGSTATLGLLKAELNTPRSSAFDMLPLSLLLHQFSGSPTPCSGSPTPCSSSPVPCNGSPTPCSHPSMPRERCPAVASELVSACSHPSMPRERCQAVASELVSAAASTDEIPNDREDFRDSRNRDCDAATKHAKVAPSVSQFLTLTLFKDTLMAFIIGVRGETENDTQTDRHDSDIPGGVPRPRCHCPVCPLHGRSRRNKTYQHDLREEGHRLPDTNWNLFNNRLRHTQKITNPLITNSGHLGDGAARGVDCTYIPEPLSSSKLPLPRQHVKFPATDPKPRATDPMPRATDPMPRATDPKPRATDPMPRATDPMPRATDPKPRATDPMPWAYAKQPLPSNTRAEGTPGGIMC